MTLKPFLTFKWHSKQSFFGRGDIAAERLKLTENDFHYEFTPCILASSGAPNLGDDHKIASSLIPDKNNDKTELFQ